MDVATTHLDSLAHVFAVFLGLEIDNARFFRNYTLCHALHSTLFGLLCGFPFGKRLLEKIVVVRRLNFVIVVLQRRRLMYSRVADQDLVYLLPVAFS